MNHRSCCRWQASIQHLTANLLVCVWLFCSTALCVGTVVAGEEVAVIRSAKATVHCGPGNEYYATQELRKGERVWVVDRDASGWVAIQPPLGSYCWLSAKETKLLPNGREVEIVGGQAVCWVGSLVKQSDYRWQSQLSVGTKVNIQDETQRTQADGTQQLWYRIDPPAGEMRWVRIEHLGAVDEVAEGISIAAVPSSDPKASAGQNDSAVKTASATEVVDSKAKSSSRKIDRKVQLASNYEPVAAPKPPRRLSPSSINSSEMRAIQPASATSPVAARPVSESQRPSSRPNPRPSPDGEVDWDQWQAFPTSKPRVPNRPVPQQQSSTAVSPMEWIFSDFLHRGEGAGQVDPNDMRPIANPSPSQRGSAGDAREDSQLGPYRARTSELPRPRRRNGGEPTLARRSPDLMEGTLENRRLDYASRDYRSDGSLAYQRDPREPFRPFGSERFATAAYSESGSQRDWPQQSSWHGIGTMASSASESAMGVDAYAPVSISSPSLQQQQLELSAAVAKPIEQWNLVAFRNSLEEQIAQSGDPLFRGEARLLLDRVEAFIQLKNRALGGNSAMGLWRGAAPEQSGQAAAPASPTAWVNASQYDATGWLVPVHATHPGQPEYALSDDRGNTLAYVSALPGVNLRRYLRQPVGLKGRRGFLSELSANHIVVDRVVQLER
ncbi:MAG: hypothetical protein RLY14_3087 [Planctomycetota bacterium]